MTRTLASPLAALFSLPPWASPPLALAVSGLTRLAVSRGLAS